MSVEIEIGLRKLRWFMDRLYRTIWFYIFMFWVLLCLTWGTLQVRHDYDLIHNYSHFENLSSDFYTKWRTDGNPGQEP